MRINTRTRTLISFVLAACLLSLPITAFAKKGEKNFKRGMQFEQAQQWDKAAQEFTLAVAVDPSNMEYQLHFRRASFNASQTYMQQGRSLAERGDFVGANPGTGGQCHSRGKCSGPSGRVDRRQLEFQAVRLLRSAAKV